MTAIEKASNVGVRGQFGSNPWGETIYFSDEDVDGIYEGTVSDSFFSKYHKTNILQDNEYILKKF